MVISVGIMNKLSPSDAASKILDWVLGGKFPIKFSRRIANNEERATLITKVANTVARKGFFIFCKSAHEVKFVSPSKSLIIKLKTMVVPTEDINSGMVKFVKMGGMGVGIRRERLLALWFKSV